MLVLSGDHPLISAETITGLLEAHAAAGAAATVMTIELDDPGSYGRIVRDSSGEVERIVEAKAAGDADPEELEIREVNAGTYVFDAGPLAEALDRLANDNAQGEYYLGDVLPRCCARPGHRVAAHLAADHAVNLGVNNRPTSPAPRPRPAAASSRPTCSPASPSSTPPRPGSTPTSRSPPTPRSSPARRCAARTAVGAGSVVGPHTTLIDTTSASGRGAPLLPGRVRGPRRLRNRPLRLPAPGRAAREGAKAGTFVEVKNSRIGAGAKVPHLAYVGDAEVGAGQQPRRRHDHRQLRRIPQTPDRDRRPTRASALTRCWSHR